MAPRDIDLGLVPEVAEDTWEGLERRPFVRALLLWAIFSLAMLLLFFLSRPDAPHPPAPLPVTSP
jgi:hypothetical protein